MLVKIRDWKFVLLISFFALYFLFFSVLYMDEVKLPSEKWSREQFVKEFNAVNVSQIMNSRNVATVHLPEENGFLTIYHEGERLYTLQMDYGGKMIAVRDLEPEVPETFKLKAWRDQENIYLYSLENKTLQGYVVDWKTGQVIRRKVMGEEVRDMAVAENLVFFAGEQGLQWTDGGEVHRAMEGLFIEKLEVLKADNLYHIAFVEKKADSSKVMRYALYNPLEGSLKSQEIGNITSNTSISLGHIDIGSVENDLYIIAVSTDAKFGSSTVEYFQFPVNRPEGVERGIMAINGYAPNPVILHQNKKDLTFIATTETTKGNNKKMNNLVEFTFRDGEIIDKKLLSKTDGLSVSPQWFQVGENYYLQWIDIVGNKKRIMLAGNSPQIMEAAGNLRGDQWMRLFMDTTLGLVPITYIATIPLMYTFVPIMILMFIGSMVKLSWMEQNTMKVLYGAVGIHTLAKLSFTYSAIFNNENLGDVLPAFIKNPFVFGILFLLTTVIAFYCVMNYMTKKGKPHFFSSYAFFAIVDIFLYGLLVLPYYYTYITLAYFTKL
ncbi:hypothetical protein [Geosporobacter ferrireducens]|uniref:hypothetical protein n=1 Tax=Geosporobacter ferrireducens TaxID=1424294 RepID=UPI00139B3ED9|nr:hypothetical protein [Geosporobacter ferrireducens]MTI53593.1 MFS transporter [Geosporobacter ferrireducens]